VRGLASLALNELSMSLRRRGLWIAFGLLFIFHTVLLFSPPPVGEWIPGETAGRNEVWSLAGRFLVALNVFFPVIAGILTADRVQRDFRLGMRELQSATPLSPAAYVATKYAGALVACLIPLLAWAMGIAVVMTAIGHAAPQILIAVPAAFATITIPAFAFVVAFSIMCPLFMPVPVYQVLFTGYWFWANFIPPKLFPTLNGTLLTPSGMFALQGFFGGPVSAEIAGRAAHGPGDAVLNLIVLASLTAAALSVLVLLLKRQAKLA
jgi:ABC-2 type transport system permease protein